MAFSRSAVSKGITGSVIGNSAHIYNAYSWNAIDHTHCASHLSGSPSFVSHNKLLSGYCYLFQIGTCQVLAEHMQVNNWVLPCLEKIPFWYEQTMLPPMCTRMTSLSTLSWNLGLLCPVYRYLLSQSMLCLSSCWNHYHDLPAGF